MQNHSPAELNLWNEKGDLVDQALKKSAHHEPLQTNGLGYC